MDTQQLARNQLDGILRAAASISGINYEQRIEELEAQNTVLVATLAEIAKDAEQALDQVSEDVGDDDEIVIAFVRASLNFVYYCPLCEGWFYEDEGIPDECGGAECPDCGGDLQTEDK